MSSIFRLSLIGLFFLIGNLFASGKDLPTCRIEIETVNSMPTLPKPFDMRNWKQTALDFDRFAFDFDKKGEYLPLIWLDNTRINFDQAMFGMHSYIGDNRQKYEHSHESIVAIGAVVGGFFAGIDKSNQNSRNYAAMCEGYFKASQDNVFLDGTTANSGGSFWYDILPNIMAFQLSHFYKSSTLDAKVDIVAQKHYEAVMVLKDKSEDKKVPDFNYTAFNFVKMMPVDNGRWLEPDAAAGYAWLQYMAWVKSGDEKYLESAKECLDFLEQKKENPLYELILSYGVYTAARMNAEHGTAYDVEKYINWCFGPSDARYGWGVISADWNGYDVSGLVGSLVDGGGYVFAMNTFVYFESFIPSVRYDDRLAYSVGKWALNASNSLRLLYAGGLPKENQTCYDWSVQNDPCFTLTYEGLRKEYKGKAPYAMGDPLVHKWAQTDFAVYGAAYTGMLGGIIEPTNIKEIFRFDCTKGDFYQKKSYPTYLYYNPTDIKQTVKIPLDEKKYDIYDAVSNCFVQKKVSKQYGLEIKPDTSMLIVIIPSGAEIKYDKYRTFANDVAIDYNNGKAALPAASKTYSTQSNKKPDLSNKLEIPFTENILIDGLTNEWQTFDGNAVKMETASGGKLKSSVRFAWNNEFLFVLIKEIAGDDTKKEAADINGFALEPWMYDSLSLYMDIDNSNNREAVGEFNIWFAFNSNNTRNIFCARTHRPKELGREILLNSQCAASGTIEKGDRVIEAAISWHDISKNVSKLRQPNGNLAKFVKQGFSFGCEPLLLDDSYKTQSYFGGIEQPFGNDKNSYDLVLISRK